MTKLEWCRQNAPKLYSQLSDDELLAKMGDTYEEYLKVSGEDSDDLPSESVEYSPNEINDHLDYMVLELSREFGNKLAFKGGYMLTKIMRNSARQTTDIDFSILTSEIYEDIKSRLIYIAETFISQGVIDAFKVKDTIQPTMSGGIDMYKNGQKILGVDVGWHDTTYGTIIRHLDVGSINSFEIERMVSDKISAILSKKRFRRAKDIYDLYCISQNFDIDMCKVSDYMRNHGDKVVEWDNYPFSSTVLREYEKAYNKLLLTSVYKNTVLPKPDFEKVYYQFCILVDKLLLLDSNSMWRHDKQLFM